MPSELHSILITRPKTLLFLAYFYPPTRHYEIAGQRPAKFAKYLADFGWRTVVVTRQWDDLSVDDPLAYPLGMPDCASWDVKKSVSAALHDVESNGSTAIRVPFRRTRFTDATRRIVNLANKNRPFIAARKMASFGYYLQRNVTGTNWLINARRAVDELSRQLRVDALVATAAPPDTLGLGCRIANQLEIPWIADMRDKWEDMFPTKATSVLHLPWGRKIVATAREVIEISEELVAIEGKLLKRKPICIPNGFDRADYTSRQHKANSRFTIVYTGSLLPSRSPSCFFQGLRRFTNGCDQRLDERFQVVYLGRSGEQFMRQAVDHAVERFCDIRGHQPRATALDVQLGADVLLLLADRSGRKGIATGKIYEYFAAGRPILAVPGDGSTVDRLLRETNTGRFCNSPEDVAQTLNEWFQQWQHGGISFKPRQDEIEKYSRRNQAKLLAEILDKTVESDDQRVSCNRRDGTC